MRSHDLSRSSVARALGEIRARDQATLDDLLASCARIREQEVARSRDVLLERDRFMHTASCTLERVVRATCETIAERLDDHGGGGLVTERTAEHTRGHRLVLWMSLVGPVAPPARFDRNSYIRFDVDTRPRRVEVWKGDMWNKRGASRRADPVPLEDLRTESITERAVRVFGRTSKHYGVNGTDRP